MFTANSLSWLHLKTVTNKKNNFKFLQKDVRKKVSKTQATPNQIDGYIKICVLWCWFEFLQAQKSSIGDKILDALINMWQFYKKPRKVEKPTSDDEWIFSKSIKKVFKTEQK